MMHRSQHLLKGCQGPRCAGLAPVVSRWASRRASRRLPRGARVLSRHAVCRRAIFRCALLLVTLLAMAPEDATALPAFARAYNMPCSTCHSYITRRSEFGDVFRRQGYHWPGLSTADYTLRDPSPVAMEGTSPMTTQLPIKIPIAIAARFSASATNDEAATEEVALASPAFSFLFGNALSEHVSVFGTWAGQGAPNELFLHFAKIADRPELNFRVGRFEQWTTLFKNNERLFAPFQLGTSNISGHTVGQGRVGVEMNGTVLRRGFYALGTLQNKAPGSAMDKYAHLGLKIGGMDFLGKEPALDLDSESPLDNMVLTFGSWAYSGEVSTVDGSPTDDIRRVGADVKYHWNLLSIWGGAMFGFDRDKNLRATNRSVTAFSEISYSFTPWLSTGYMFEAQSQSAKDVPNGSKVFSNTSDRHHLGAVFLLLENVRGRLTGVYTPDAVKNERIDLQLLAAF